MFPLRRRLLIALADFLLLPLGSRSTLTFTYLPERASRPLVRPLRRRLRRRRLPIPCPSLWLYLPMAHVARGAPMSSRSPSRPVRPHRETADGQVLKVLYFPSPPRRMSPLSLHENHPITLRRFGAPMLAQPLHVQVTPARNPLLRLLDSQRAY